MMTRSFLLAFLGLVLVICGGLACTSKSVEPSIPTAHGYTFSLCVSAANLWVGSPSLMDSRPGNAELIVEVRDTQGRRVEGVPVAFRVTPSWAQSATLMPQDAFTHDGTARAVFEPHTIGVVQVMAQVDGETQATKITVEPRYYGKPADAAHRGIYTCTRTR